MQGLNLGKSDVLSSRLVYGCMRMAGDGTQESREKGKAAVRAALEEGYTHFDHADIYGDGQCEALFSEVLRDMPGVRDRILITSKCGIRRQNTPTPGDPTRYDFSREYIAQCVEGSLARLKTDHLDLLLLHRPDYLFNAGEVAAAFDALKISGKVLHFGVSNFCPSQVSLLQSCCPMPLLVNQVQINIHALDALLDGTLDQCQEWKISPQAWCPLGGVAYPAWGNRLSKEDESRIQAEFNTQAKQYGVDPWIIMLAWLLKHPSGIFPIIGSTTPSRIAAAKQALDLPYSRENWYRLLEARTGQPVP